MRRSPYDREIFRLALPALGALAAEPLYLLVDTAIVGHLGTPQLAALALAGALLGALAGVVGTLVAWAIGIPLSLALSETTNALLVRLMQRFDPGQAEQLRQILEQAQAQPLSQRLPTIVISALLGAVVYVAFSTLGGLLGVSLFEKRKGEAGTPPPPPPAGFGGAQPPTSAPPPSVGPGGPF